MLNSEGTRMVPPRSGSFIVGAKSYSVERGAPVLVRAADVEALAAQGWVTQESIEATDRAQRAAVDQRQRYQEVPHPPVPVGDAIDRLLPPLSGNFRRLVVNGRTYDGSDGAPQDVPRCDSRILCANSWLFVGTLGTAAERPKRSVLGDRRYEGEPGSKLAARREVIWDGLAWRDVLTGAVV